MDVYGLDGNSVSMVREAEVNGERIDRRSLKTEMEVWSEWRMGAPHGLHDAARDQTGTGGTGVGVIDRKERRGTCLAKVFEPFNFNRCYVQHRDAFSRGDLPDPAVVTHIRLDMPIFPDVAHGCREQGDDKSAGMSLDDHLAQVPAEGVYRFGLAGERAGGLHDVLRLLADAFQGTARFGTTQIPAVVVPHLQQQRIAWLHLL